jgi:hypothetical protein
MKHPLILLALFFSVCLCVAETLEDRVAYEQRNVDNEAVAAYGGKVGKLDAIFLIEWDGEPNNTLNGFYYYPSRGRHLQYRLSGTNPKPGVLVLQEFTATANGGDVLSATCRLTKRVSGDRVIWEGKMNNTDGRVLPMSFSRKNQPTHFQ